MHILLEALTLSESCITADCRIIQSILAFRRLLNNWPHSNIHAKWLEFLLSRIIFGPVVKLLQYMVERFHLGITIRMILIITVLHHYHESILI